MSNTTTTLDDLIETLKDGQEGFHNAAENVQSSDLKTTLESFAQQRARFATELQGLARSHGEPKPTSSSSLAGSLHRGWINLKGAITSHSDHAILAECERGEDSAVAEFQKALDANLDADVLTVVRRQATEVKAVHDRVRDLRDGLAAK